MENKRVVKIKFEKLYLSSSCSRKQAIAHTHTDTQTYILVAFLPGCTFVTLNFPNYSIQTIVLGTLNILINSPITFLDARRGGQLSLA